MKALVLIVSGLCLCVSVWAQPTVSLRMAFNTEQNRYEVFATPNFSARNFTWGPSQVSVVLPAEVVNEPLSVRSANGGAWSDNSLVFSPESAKEVDFHGITSLGARSDLVAGEEFLLFDFSLKTGFVANVRLFNVNTDPGSAQSGMQGGDFRSYIADEQGKDYLQIDSREVALASREPLVTTDQAVIAYPNPSLNGKFRLYLKGFAPDETVTVRLFNLNGRLQRSFEEKVETLAGRLIDAGSQENSYIVLSLERQLTHKTFVHKLWFR